LHCTVCKILEKVSQAKLRPWRHEQNCACAVAKRDVLIHCVPLLLCHR